MRTEAEDAMRNLVVDFMVKCYGKLYLEEVTVSRVGLNKTDLSVTLRGGHQIVIKDCCIRDKIKLFKAMALIETRKENKAKGE